MAEITAGAVKQLRDTTGAGMMDCKRALEETSGDFEAAQDLLRTKGLAKAAKKAGRVAAEGLIAVALSDDLRVGAVIELNSETDFVARNELFRSAARTIAKVALRAGGDIAVVREARTDSGQTVGELVTGLVATVGENMEVRRAARLGVGSGVVGWYVHPTGDLGRLGVLVALESAGDREILREAGRKLGMHISHANPLALTAEELDPAVVARERAIYAETAAQSGKPPAVVEKIVEGQIRKFYEAQVLLKQAFVIDPDQTVEQFLAQTGKAAGAAVAITGFARLALGEGVDKAQGESLAAEVAALSPGR
ncbi:MAG TPA: translation elongation factor Ts [Caulobacteraceae bacterium]|nr:translation elongation factor Ts [Caulobacteraceae bacterium]